MAILWPAGTGSRTATTRPSTRSSMPGESGTRATAMLSCGFKWIAEFSAVGSFAISSSIGLNLPQEYRFGDFFAQVHVQLGTLGMNPDAAAIFGHGNFGWTVDDHEARGLHAIEQFAYMDMRVALRPALFAINCKAPAISPKLASLLDCGRPQFQTLLRSHLGQRMRPGQVVSGQSQETIRFTRIDIFQEKDPRLGRLLLRLAA